jgi:hypothetical protein
LESSKQPGAFPIEIRRVVTGHDAAGQAVIAATGTPPRTDVFQHIPGMVSRLVWATPAVPQLPHDGKDPTASVTSIVPGPGASRLLIVTFPPDSVFAAPGFDPEAAVRENLAVSPGLAERFEPDGMHQTPTVDYGIVLDGEIWLEVDGGRSERLARNDVVIQNGTRHAWRNKSEQPATLAFVLLGARGMGKEDQ